MTDWKGTRKRRDVWGWLSCSALSRTFFLQYWNMVPSVEVHLKKKNCGPIFIKQELLYALQNESFLHCGINLIKTCPALSTYGR